MRAALLTLLPLVLFACTDVPADNPYDPAAPESVQATSTVTGRLRLPEGFATDSFAEVRVRLSPVGVDTDPREAQPNAEGDFIFSGVLAGGYLLSVESQGFRAPPAGISVIIGRDLDVGDVALEAPRAAEVDSAVEGTARRSGGGAAGHAGITVQAQGTPYLTVTGDDGQFRLELPPGRAILRFSAEGHGVEERTVDVVAGQTLSLEPVIVTGEPGRVQAIVRLEQFQTPERLSTVSVSLVSEGVTVQQGSPNEDGEVTFDDVLASEYTVEVSRPGYVADRRDITTYPGGDAFAGLFELQHTSRSPQAVSLSGRILLIDRPDHSGTRVQARLSPDDLAFAEAITDADGRFTLPAAPDERYTLSVSREGYTAPGEIGPLQWAEDRFVDEAGNPVETTLARDPIEGEIRLRVHITPEWLPLGERYARVTLIGPAPGTEEPVFDNGEPVVFSDLPEGNYTVQVTRPGFSLVQRPVTLTQAQPRADLEAITITLQNLAQARLDLRGQTIDACDLRAGITVAGADLAGANLTGHFGEAVGCPEGVTEGPINLLGADLSQADLTGAILGSGEGAAAILIGARLSGATLTGVDLKGVVARDASFANAEMERVSLAGADLRGADFTAARLGLALFVEAERDEEGLPLADAESPWPDLGAPLEPWPEAPCGPDGPTVKLEGALFARADLTRTFMPGVNLAGADLGRSSLALADLRFACMFRARLNQLDLSGATLDGADLREAQMSATLLRRTSVRGTRLSQASLINAVIDETDIRPSPTCDTLPPWSDYDPGARCNVEPIPEDCRCRTRLDGAALDGANLVGASLGGVDLFGATLRGATIGQAPRLSFLQPAACFPEAYFTCRRFAEYRQACPGRENQTLQEWLAFCNDSPLGDVGNFYKSPRDGGTRLVAQECILGLWNGGACPDESPCFSDEEGEVLPEPENPFVNTCEWTNIREGDGIPGEGDCSFQGEIRLHPACLVAPTTLDDVRLDGVVMPGAVFDAITLNNVSAININLAGASFFDATLEGVDFTGADLRDARMDDLDLADETFAGADLSGASLRGASLMNADLSAVLLDSADLTEANLSSVVPPASMRRARIVETYFDTSDALVGMNFESATLQSLNIIGPLDGSNFTRAEIRRGHFQRNASCTGCIFDQVRFTDVRLRGNLDGTSFVRARLDDLALGERTNLPSQNSGVSALGTVFDHSAGQQLHTRYSDLTGASFREVELSGSTFERSTMHGINFYQAQITESSFDESEFTDACMRGADFQRSTFNQATFDNVSMVFSDFSGGSFVQADLTGACQVVNANFNGANMSRARICEGLRETFEERFGYFGEPQWVLCEDNPVCEDCR
ncbi:MAG: pentapeptide repeat-containing protein [Bradymonadia bacterium]